MEVPLIGNTEPLCKQGVPRMGISLGTTGRVRLTIIFALFCFLIPSNSSAEDFRVNIEGTLGDVEGTFGSDFEFADGQDFIATLFFLSLIHI